VGGVDHLDRRLTWRRACRCGATLKRLGYNRNGLANGGAAG